MDSSTTTPTAQRRTHSHSPTPTSAGACPQKPSICNCTTPSNETYHQSIIGCTNKKCRPRYYHLRCVGLLHRPDNEFTWLCPACAPDVPLPPRICICEDPPYRTGPMVECTLQELCATRWFHLPCAGIDFGSEGMEWICAECSVEIIMRKDREKGLERQGAYGEEVMEQEKEKEQEVEPSRENGEVVEEEEKEDEAEQREYVSDGVPGVFLVEEDESPAPAAASHLKRKSAEVDIPPRKKSKHTSTPSPSPSPAAEETSEYCVCGTLANDNMIACDAPNCRIEWFHFVCVGLTAATIPEGEWFCDGCAEVREKAKKNKRKKGGKGKRKK